MMNPTRLVATAVASFACLAGVALVGCDDRSDAERRVDHAGDKVENAAEKAGDNVEKAADRAGDKLEKAGDKVKDAAN
jgi:hypothetical protein